MRLYLLRHTQTLVAQGVCYGQTDVLCSPENDLLAARQARRILPSVVSVSASPLQRCEQLAKTLCGLEPSFSYKTDVRLMEMHFGAWEGVAWDVIAAQELADWTADFAHYRCGGTGESTAQMLKRVAQALLEARACGHDQLWVTHAGVIRSVLWLLAQEEDCIAWAESEPQRFHDWLSARVRAREWPSEAIDWGQLRVIELG